MNSQQFAHGAVQALALYGGGSLVFGAILALIGNLKAHKRNPDRFPSYMRGWWWRVPVAAGIIAAASIPFGTAFLVFMVGIGMSAGVQSGGGGALWGVLVLFVILSSALSYLLLRSRQSVPQPAERDCLPSSECSGERSQSGPSDK